MAGTHLPQTKRAVQAMKNAGYKRSDFKAYTPFDRKAGGYDRTRVICWKVDLETQLERLPKVLESEDLDAIVTYGKDGKPWHISYLGGNGNLKEWHPKAFS